MQVLQPENENIALQEKKTRDIWSGKGGTTKSQGGVSPLKTINRQNLSQERRNGPTKRNLSRILEAQP